MIRPAAQFPDYRPRRLRQTPVLRAMVRENQLRPENLILPLFAREGLEPRIPVKSMPGIFQLSLAEIVKEASAAHALGVPGVILFGIPQHKDEKASQAFAADGIVQQAVRILKKEIPSLFVITDVCLCEYMSHGHCGLVEKRGSHAQIMNDPSLALLADSALSHVEAGADMVAPSDMMDGRIGAIRKKLDTNGFANLPIMAYSAKYSSGFYGPFRDAAESAPQFGDRKSYQMDPANSDEAIREAAQDIAEGADIVMVKPALSYLDVLYRIKTEFNYPTAAYAVSGEYSMIKAAAQNGWIDERALFMETHLSMIRAGASIILTYAAPLLARTLKEG